MVNTGYFAKDRTNGPVFRLFLDIRTMSQGASTNIPALAGRTPRIDRIGISYMYFGTWQSKDGSSGGAFAPSHRAIPGYTSAAMGRAGRPSMMSP
jgi:hypothetical protein